MSRFHGPQHRGATRELRDRRRIQANTRNALTKAARRAQRRTANADAEARTS